MNVGEKEVPQNAIFDKVEPFDWHELHGKVLVITVAEDKPHDGDKGCVCVMGTDENGVSYVLNSWVYDA